MGRKAQVPWERMPKESDPAWEAFVTYRDMPEETGLKRSCARVARQLGKSTTIIERWCSAHNWVERCSNYDSYTDEQKIAERTKQRRKQIEDEEKMDQRQASLAVQLQHTVLDKIRAAENSEEPLPTKEISDLTRALKNLADVERAAMHATSSDRQIELNREMFEYKKEMDAGANIEYEDLDETEAAIYGDDEEES